MKALRKRALSTTAVVASLVGAMTTASHAAVIEPVAKPVCGQVITRTIILGADVGPCAGDGLIIRSSNITVLLNGHRIFGTEAQGAFAGIALPSVTGVTISGPGTISGFDAGVTIDGGSRNTIKGVTLRDNVGPDLGDLGDGIGVFFSSGNRILGNTISNSGTYDGIGVFGGLPASNDNLIQDNTVENSFGRRNMGGIGIIVNPFLDPSLPRMNSVFRNNIVNNTVRGNQHAGISSISNIDGRIEGNIAIDNGTNDNAPGNGIGVSHLLFVTADTRNIVTRNTVSGSNRGIVNNQTENTQITRNSAVGNGLSLYDVGGFDFDSEGNAFTFCSPGAVWSRNSWNAFGETPYGAYFPECVGNGAGPRPSVFLPNGDDRPFPPQVSQQSAQDVSISKEVDKNPERPRPRFLM